MALPLVTHHCATSATVEEVIFSAFPTMREDDHSFLRKVVKALLQPSLTDRVNALFEAAEDEMCAFRSFLHGNLPTPSGGARSPLRPRPPLPPPHHHHACLVERHTTGAQDLGQSEGISTVKSRKYPTSAPRNA